MLSHSQMIVFSTSRSKCLCADGSAGTNTVRSYAPVACLRGTQGTMAFAHVLCEALALLGGYVNGSTTRSVEWGDLRERFCLV